MPTNPFPTGNSRLLSPGWFALWFLASLGAAIALNIALHRAVHGFGPLRDVASVLVAILATAALAWAFRILPGTWGRWAITVAGIAAIALPIQWWTFAALLVGCLFYSCTLP